MHCKKHINLFLISSIFIITETAGFGVDMQTLFADGEKAFAAGAFTDAAKYYEQILTQTPGDLRSRFRYGQALFSMKKYAESCSQFQSVLQNAPNNISARIFLSESLICLDRADEARPHLEWIIRIQPGHVKAKNLLAAINPAVQLMPESIPENIQPIPAETKTEAQSPKIDEASFVPVKPQQIIKKPENNTPGASQAQAFQLSNSVNSQTEVKTAPRQTSRPRTVIVNTDETALITDFTYQSFVQSVNSKSSFTINLELAKFYLEKADFESASRFLASAMKLSENTSNSRRLLEARILSLMLCVYQGDYKSFGPQLMELKTVLSEDSYASFLNVYNQGLALTSEANKARLGAGIALGSGHFAAAVKLFQRALNEYPDDVMLLYMLSEAQLQAFEYVGAETTLNRIFELNEKNPDACFNLARFYLSVFYRPDQVRGMIACGQALAPEDRRFDILSALADYAEGKVESGIGRMKAVLPEVADESLRGLCQQIISDGELQKKTKMTADQFAAVIALPGAPHAPVSSYCMVGEDYLARGSMFSAIDFFTLAKDNAEVARAYLAFASLLDSSGEEETALAASDFGTQLLRKEAALDPKNSKVCLYAAIQCAEMHDEAGARQAISMGLAGSGDEFTKKRLTTLLNSLSIKSDI